MGASAGTGDGRPGDGTDLADGVWEGGCQGEEIIGLDIRSRRVGMGRRRRGGVRVGVLRSGAWDRVSTGVRVECEYGVGGLLCCWISTLTK